MFGYVVIDKPNILVKDFYNYRAYYCGICKSIGNQSGQLMRCSLNYDIVLLSLLGHNYEKLEPEIKQSHCIAHPIGKKINYVIDNDILKRIADINTVLAYYKIIDDTIDEGKHKSIKLMLTPVFNSAKKRDEAFCDRVAKSYEKLRAVEKEGQSLEKSSDCFGYTMIAVADKLTPKSDSLLRELLFYVGKWVYCIDAFDDLEKDYKKGCYNPFLREVKEMSDTIKDNIELSAREFLYSCIEKIIEIYDKMDITISEGPLSNIIYLGLKQRTEFVLTKRREKCQKIHS